jgi:tRNA A-37 threonylcarbamoyl transferase component Bud32
MYELTEEFDRICTKIVGQNYKFQKLNGGINNAVFLINNKKEKYVLKKVINNTNSVFDKYIAEKQFLEFATKIEGVNTPKLLDNYDTEKIIILEYIKPDNNSGKIKINDKKIRDCIKFINEIKN